MKSVGEEQKRILSERLHIFLIATFPSSAYKCSKTSIDTTRSYLRGIFWGSLSVNDPTKQYGFISSLAMETAYSEISIPYASTPLSRKAVTRYPIAQPASNTVLGLISFIIRSAISPKNLIQCSGSSYAIGPQQL